MTQSQRLRNYIRAARKRAGLSQEELTFLLGGRGGKNVSRYELFEREPKLPAALACQVALGLPVHEIFSELYARVRKTVARRARVLELRLRRLPGNRLVERKRATVERIVVESDRRKSSPSS